MLGVANVDLALDDGDVHSKTFSTRVQQQMNTVFTMIAIDSHGRTIHKQFNR